MPLLTEQDDDARKTLDSTGISRPQAKEFADRALNPCVNKAAERKFDKNALEDERSFASGHQVKD